MYNWEYNFLEKHLGKTKFWKLYEGNRVFRYIFKVLAVIIFKLLYRYVFKENTWNIANTDFYYYLFYLYFSDGYGGKYKKRYNNYGGIEVFIRGNNWFCNFRNDLFAGG